MKSTVIKGMVWSTGVNYLVIILNLLGTIALSRTLLPEEFGVVAYATGIFMLGMILCEWGITSYIIKTNDKSRTTANKVFSIQLFITLATYVIILLIHPTLFSGATTEHFFIFAGIGAGMGIMYLSQAARGEMLKNMKYKTLASIHLLAYFISVSISIVLAYTTNSIWAIVIFTTLPEMIKGILFGIISKIKVQKPNKKDVKKIYDYAKHGFIITVCDKSYRQTDYLVIENIIGTVTLGFYSQAYKLSEMFSNLSWGSVGSVSSSIFGKFKKQKDILERNYTRISSLVIRSTIFLYLPLFLLAEQAITFIYGDKWLAMVPLFQALIIFSLLTPYRRINRTLHMNTGDPKSVAKAHIVELIFFAVTIAIGTYFFGVYGAILAVNIGMIAGLITILRNTRKIIPLRFKKIFLNPVFALISTGIIYYFLQTITQINQAFWHLAINATLISLIYLAILFALERKELISMVKEIIEQHKKKKNP